LAALNHGTFRSPIRAARRRTLRAATQASEIGEIKITEDQNLIISIQVTGVDIEPILRAAEANDNAGNRRADPESCLLNSRFQIPVACSPPTSSTGAAPGARWSCHENARDDRRPARSRALDGGAGLSV
jgi:hypothetical protein